MDQVDQPLKRVLTPKSVAKYALLPGIFPGLQRITMHISQFMFMFTQIFGAIGLINENHPCLRPENVGRYRFGDIVGLAASNLVFDRRHLPQTLMFFVVILSIVLLIAIGISCVASLILYTAPAHAQFFGTPTQFSYNQNEDWALRFLFRIFGATSFFGAPVNTQGMGNPWFTTILVGMLRYYSLAMLVIAAFMILYLMLITLTEAARSGKPFGSRFDSIWAPIRLALAIGLLIPISSPGYNGAQLMVFQAAVWGSNLATNTWYSGVNAIQGKQGADLFAKSMTDPGYKFLRDILMVNLCIAAYQDTHSDIELLLDDVQYSIVVNDNVVTYSFGPHDAPDLCGQVVVLAHPPKSQSKNPTGLTGKSWPERTIDAYQEIAKLFLPVPPGSQLTSQDVPVAPNGSAIIPPAMANIVPGSAKWIMANPQDSFAQVVKDPSKMTPSAQAGGAAVLSWVTAYRKLLGSEYDAGKNEFSPFFTNGDFPGIVTAYNKWVYDSLTADAKYGWTTAGVFYLRISSALSAISQVANNPPRVSVLPTNFSKKFATKDNPSANSETVAQTCSSLWRQFWHMFGDELCTKYKTSLKINKFLQGGADWFLSSVQNDSPIYHAVGGQAFDQALAFAQPETSTNLDAGWIFQGILDRLYESAKIQNGDLNPIGAVINWGNTFIGMAMVAYSIALVGMGTGMSSLAMEVATMLMIPGFILAFYIPMVPFLHFTFAVVEWMISILEAVIGMPLWALSMISLEGDGFGKGLDGIKAIFEIILRPTIIVMSLMVAVLMFTASISFFNDAIEMYAGASSQSGQSSGYVQATLSGLGMIFIYMFGVYSLANSCFKLIEIIPDNFGRWVGLKKGFGGDIKVGIVGGIGKAIVGGVLVNNLMKAGSNTVGVGKGLRSEIKKAKDKKGK